MEISSFQQSFDAHMHGPISFHEYSLRVQGYTKKNILQLLYETCIKRKISFCAITSNNENIAPGSIHDRFEYIIRNYANLLPREYTHDRLGKNIFVVDRGDYPIYFINGQSVIAIINKKRVDHLVVGSNKVPNFMSLEDSIKYGKDYGLLQISEHPYSKAHYGIGEQELEKHLKDYDAIEHNSQLILPRFFSLFPYFRDYSMTANEKANRLAERHHKPFIATSDAHCIEHAGISSIAFHEEIATKSEESVLNDIKSQIRIFSFTRKASYITFREWSSWIVKGQFGELFRLYKEKSATQQDNNII